MIKEIEQLLLMLRLLILKDTERLIGDAAKNQVAMNPVSTVFDAKHLIGRRFGDASVQADMKLWPFNVVPGPADKPMIIVNYKGGEKQFAAEEISSMVLIKMREIEFFLEDLHLHIWMIEKNTGSLDF